jgi:hypothetical protein
MPTITSTPRCRAIVDLVSRFERPWKFEVTVRGLPPHDWTRKYTIVVPNAACTQMDAEEAAANKGMEAFMAECQPIPGVGSIVPRARRVG